MLIKSSLVGDENEFLSALKARDEMMAIVSHDLRNPLAAIMLQVKLMQKSLEIKGEIPDLKDKLIRIGNSCNRMNRLIQDILDVTSIEGGKFKLNCQHFSVASLLLDMMNSFQEIAESNGVELIQNVHNEEHVAFGDRERTGQILMNLISNSLKFTPRGGKIIVNTDEKKGDTYFSVQDTGTGISDEALPHIFNRFWQGHKVSGSLGIGLGLSIVKGIVDAHNGKIWVESAPAQGTKFTFVLPKSD
jgi:signal transduction histidine kinase